MKNFGKISAAVLLVSTLALTGCQSVNIDNKETKTPENSTSANISPSAEPTATPAEPFAVDLAKPNPMGQDISALNAETQTPEVYDYYTPEQFQTASTVGLNWLEQVMSVPTMFENNRVLTEDNVRLQDFIQNLTPNAQTLVNTNAAAGGAVYMLPYGDNDGKILANYDDGTPFDLGLKWDNKVPETTWHDVATVGVQAEGYPYGIMVYAIADHTALDDKGQEKTVAIAYSVTLYEVNGTWLVNNWNWDLKDYAGN